MNISNELSGELLSLQEQMNEVFAPEAPEQFSIKTLEDLQWYLGKLETLTLRIQEHEKLASKKLEALDRLFNEAKERVQAEFLNETTELRHSLQFLSKRYGHQAHAFALKRLAEGKKGTKSFKLGSCQLGHRKDPDKYIVQNKDTVIDWAISQNLDEQLLRMETSIKARELEAYCKKADTLPGGVLKQEGKDAFFVRIAGMELFEMTQESWETTSDEGNPEIQSEGDELLQSSLAEHDPHGRVDGQAGAEQPV